MFCSACGKQVADQADFCPGCGAPMSQPAAAKVPPFCAKLASRSAPRRHTALRLRGPAILLAFAWAGL
jgi:predicted amidophosphoribosyltransferase